MPRFVLWEANRAGAPGGYQVMLILDAGVAADGLLAPLALVLHVEGSYLADGGQIPVPPKDIQLQMPGTTGALHDFLFDPANAGGERRLKSWASIQAEVGQRAAAERLKLLTEIELFRRSFASFTVATNQAGAVNTSFLGLTAIGAQALTQFTAEIELPGLLPETARHSERHLLRLSVQGKFNGTILGQTLAAQTVLKLEVGLDREQKLACNFIAGIQRAAGLDPVFDFPPIPLPDLSLTGLQASALQFGQNLLNKCRPLALPLPDLEGLEVEWSSSQGLVAELAANGTLTIGTSAADAIVRVNGCALFSVTDCQIQFDSNSGFTIAGTLSASFNEDLLGHTLDPALTGPVTIRLAEMHLRVSYADPNIKLVQNIGRIEIRAKEDPDLVLAFKATLVTTLAPGGQPPHYELTELELIDPYPIKLLVAAAQLLGQAAAELLSFVQEIHFSPPGLPAMPTTGIAALLDRLQRFIAAIMQWIGRQAGELGKAIAGLARSIADLIAKLLSGLHSDNVNMTGLSIEIRLDRTSFALRQLIVSPIYQAGAGALNQSFRTAGLCFELQGNFMPALIYDFQQGWGAFALIPYGVAGNPTANAGNATVSTDLWLARDEGTVEQGSVSNGPGNDDQPLIKLEASIAAPAAGAASPALVLAGIRDGRPFFFSKLESEEGALPDLAKVVDFANGTMPPGIRLGLGGFKSAGSLSAGDFSITPSINHDKVEKLLPFLRRSGDAQSGLAQYIEVTNIDSNGVVNGQLNLGLTLRLRIAGLDKVVKVNVSLDLNTLQIRLTDANTVIRGDGQEHDFLGMKLRFEKRDGTTPAEFDQLVLDFSSGDMLLSLHSDVVAILSYKKVSSRGHGIVFRADTFDISRNGLDLTAAISQSEPVILAGVDTPFSFHSGSLEIKGSTVQNFTLLGKGQLPPALIGDATAKVSLSFGAGKDGRLTVLAADGDIDRRADPIEAYALRFRFTLSQIGFSFKGEDNPHFYFLLTGSADFVPGEGEFQNGLLKNLSKTRIKLDRVPLTSDPRVLMRHIEFLVPIEPPVSCTLFNLFAFELRGVGFLPSSPAFDGNPALALSGKVAFMAFGDIPTVEIDIDKLLLSTPKPGQSLPQVRMDNLSVGLNLGMGRIKATAVAVDDQLPTLYVPDTLPSSVTPRGFLASGSMSISGLPDLSAAMGFLELREKGADGNLSAPRHAFFMYAQLNRLAQPVPTPFGEIILREAGFGFGFRFTLEGIARADRVTTPQQLIQVLDEVSKHANDLADPAVWWPEASGDRLTLALRLLFTMTTASAPGTYDAAREKPPGDKPQPSNPVMFDAVAALRSDGTFLMTVRAWLSVNYADWLDDSSKNWRKRPVMRGYLYLSVPRKQFLARFVGDPTGYIGDHPALPEPIKKAFSAVRWSSTLYIDESVFHFELGWPYELGYSLGSSEEDFYLNCEGGLVMRFEDGAYLQGLAFRATGLARFQGRVGDDSLGAAVTAVANFALDGKLITYLSTRLAGDSMLYGSLRIDVTVDFDVHLWVSFKVFRREIRLEAAFAVQLTVAVAAEVVLAAHAPVLGARLMVTIGVSAFGRSLRVGVGLSLNVNLLDDARARVQRFLTLGLAARYPDPAAGVPPAAVPVQPSRIEQVKKGDQAIQSEAEAKSDFERRPPGPLPAVPAPGQPIGLTRFWAILFPTRRDNTGGQWYVMQLVPRDLTDSDDLTVSTFYASPAVPADGIPCIYKAVVGGAGLDLLQFDSRNTSLSPVGGNIEPYWEKPIKTKSGQDVTLADVISGAFLPADQANNSHLLTQPDGKLMLVKRLDGSSQLEGDLDEALAHANRDRMTMSPERAAAAAVEEVRSGFIGAIGESAARLAAQGESGGSWRGRDGIDARDFGLTFLIEEAALTALRQAEEPGAPDRLAITINAWDAAADWIVPNVHLFNPPENMFNRRPPRLKQASCNCAGKITLDWDLEPTWGDSDSVYNDPEYHLKHYRICRTITGALAETAVWRTTCKASMPLARVRDDNGEWVWKFQRPPYQFIDDLGSLSPAMRNALVGKAANAGDWEKKLADWDRNFDKAVQLVYTIIAVDSAGTESDAMIIELPFDRPRLQEAALRRASLKFAYLGLPSFAAGENLIPAGTAPQLVLVMEDPVRDQSGDAKLPSGRRDQIELRLTPERIVSAGLFGIDALTDALQRPLAPSNKAQLRPGEVLVTLAAGQGNASMPCAVIWRVADPTAREGYADAPAIPYRISKLTLPDGSVATGEAALAGAKAAFGFDDRPNVNAMRVYARTLSTSTMQSAPADPAEPAEWTGCDLVLEVDHPVKADTPPAPLPLISCAVEAFEHPTDIQFAPLGAADISARTGRLTLIQPQPTASLKELLENGPDVLRPGADPRRRVGVKLKWNARPTSLALVGDKRDSSGFEALIGGYDIFSIDLTTLTTAPGSGSATPAPEQQQAMYAEHARHVGRVQLLPRRLAGMEPGETGDMAKVEAMYPSATVRQRGLDGKSVPPERAGHHSYLSSAESVVLWPKRLLRRHLMADPGHDTVDALFAKGLPTKLMFFFSPARQPAEQGLGTWLSSIKLSCGSAYDVQMDVKDGRRYFWIDCPQPAFQPDQVRRLLADLVWTGNPELERLDDLAGLTLRLLAVPAGAQAEDQGLPEVSVVLDLVGQQHAVLADLMDALRYDRNVGQGSPLVRRYEPVIDMPAPSKQQSLLGYFDEQPPERDPYGWAALRAFGLATAFRLYDTQSQRYLVGSELAELVNAAFEATLAAYADDLNDERGDAVFGAPFVDLITAPEAIMDTVGFDAGLAASASSQYVLDRAKGLIQVSLRPLASGLLFDRNPVPVRYFTVVYNRPAGADTPAPTQLVISADNAGISGQLFSIDVIQLDAADGTHQTATVLPPLLATLLGEAAVSKLSLPIAAPKDQARLALVRIVAYGAAGSGAGPVFPSAGQLLSMFELNIQLNTGSVNVARLEPYLAPQVLQQSGQQAEAFERFPPMNAPRLALLAYGSGVAPMLDASPTCGPIFTGIADWGRAFAPPDKLNLPANQQSFLQRIQVWTQRFIEHGPVREHIVPSSPQGMRIGFALATIARPDPWRIAPAPDGSIELLLPQKDRFGKMLWYLVRPFGRYDNFAETVMPERHELPGLHRAFLPRSDQADPFDVFAPAILQRSEPLAAPIILSTRRIAPAQQWQRSTVEVLIGRHPEQVLADANIRIAAQLAFREIGVGFWREFMGSSWLLNLERGALGAPTDVGAEFGPPSDAGALVPMLRPQRSLADMLCTKNATLDDVLLELDTAQPDLWPGARALYVGGLPYGFRTHVLAYASAGVVVSEQAGASFDFSDYALMLPWTEEAGVPQPGGIFLGRRASAKPHWTASCAGLDDPVEMHVELPLVRFIDSMPEWNRQQWFGGELAPALYRAVDPAVSYRLGFEAGGGQVLEYQLELVPAPVQLDLDDPLYSITPIASHFAFTDNLAVHSDHDDAGNTAAPGVPRVVFLPAGAGNEGCFALKLPLRLAARERPTPAASLERQTLFTAAALASMDPLFSTLQVTAPEVTAWSRFAPTATLTVAWSSQAIPRPPLGAIHNCQALKAAASAWHGQLLPYLDYLPAPLIATLDSLIALPDIAPNQQSGQLQVPGWIAGLPMAPGAPISAVVDIATVRWNPLQPADCVRASRSIFERTCWQLQASHPDLWQVLVPPTVGAMAQTALADWRYQKERGYGGIPRLAFPLSGTEPWALAPQLSKLAALPAASILQILVQAPLTGQALDAPGGLRRADYDALLAGLEGATACGSLLQSLLAIESNGNPLAQKIDTVVVLPLHQEAQLRTMLSAVWPAGSGAGLGTVRPHALVLHKPPSETELELFEQAATTTLGAAAGGSLAALVRQLSEEQLFGSGRRMRITCLHGRVPPEHGLISRLEG